MINIVAMLLTSAGALLTAGPGIYTVGDLLGVASEETLGTLLPRVHTTYQSFP